MNTFWGEDPAGTWTITVRDVFLADEGTWNSFDVETRRGQLIPIPEPATLGLLAVGGMTLMVRSYRRRHLAK